MYWLGGLFLGLAIGAWTAAWVAVEAGRLAEGGVLWILGLFALLMAGGALLRAAPGTPWFG